MGMLLYRHLHLRDGVAEATRLEAVRLENERASAAVAQDAVPIDHVAELIRQRDAWAHQCNLASEAQADAAHQLNVALARIAELEAERNALPAHAAAEVPTAETAPAESADVAAEVLPEFVPTVEWLKSLDEAALRVQCAEIGIEVDGRWGVGRIRRELAEHFGLEL